eukprot:115259_1
MDQTHPRNHMDSIQLQFPCWMMHTTDQPDEMLKSLIVIFKYQNDYKYCPHHKFKTSETFVKHLAKRIDELSINCDTIHPDIHREWSECCEECYSHIFIYIHMNFMKDQLLFLNMYHDISIHIMNFRTISNLCFNQSDMFTKIFYYAVSSNILQSDLQIAAYNNQIPNGTIHECNYKMGILLLLPIIVNMSLMKKIHWKILGCHFENLLKTITTEFKYNTYLTINFGNIFMNLLLMLMVFILKHTHKNQNKVMKSYNTQWRHILKKTTDKKQSAMILQFISLTNNHKLYNLYNSLNEIIVKYDNMRWKKMKCIRCRVTRQYVDLMKCKSCKVIRYCSKKCQKLDWNRYNHRQQCKTFTKMRKQHKALINRAAQLNPYELRKLINIKSF